MDDADLVVGKRQMSVAAGQGHFGHVTTDTIRLGDRTELRLARSRCLKILSSECRRSAGRRVAGYALGIVEGRTADHIPVRVVAGHTTDAWIRSIEAFAIGQPVGLEADVRRTPPVASDHRLPCSMALAAKAGEVLGGRGAQVGRKSVEFPS